MEGSRAAQTAFDAQRQMARRRGIAWEFTFEEWWAWWQIDDRWSRRGRHKGQLVMARYGDTGPYSPDNVQPLTPLGNSHDRRPEERAATVEKWRSGRTKNGRPIDYLRGVRGDGHPSSRAVLTPDGRFGSSELAGEFYGVAGSTIRRRVLRWPGWSYADPLTPLDHFYQRLLIALAWVRSHTWHGPGPDFSFAEMNAAIELCR